MIIAAAIANSTIILITMIIAQKRMTSLQHLSAAVSGMLSEAYAHSTVVESWENPQGKEGPVFDRSFAFSVIFKLDATVIVIAKIK